MSPPKTAPTLPANAMLQVLDDHRPSVQRGTYDVHIKHAVSKLDLTTKTDASFAVSAPRFSILPGEIISQFPPSGSTGKFATVLPHIVLKRSTLPWERSALDRELWPKKAKDHDRSPPWLALLVFEESELESAPYVVPAKDLSRPKNRAKQSINDNKKQNDQKIRKAERLRQGAEKELLRRVADFKNQYGNLVEEFAQAIGEHPNAIRHLNGADFVATLGAHPTELTATRAKEPEAFEPLFDTSLNVPDPKLRFEGDAAIEAILTPVGPKQSKIFAPPAEDLDDPATPVTLIDVPQKLLQGILPTLADLPYIASARRLDDGPTRAVIVANRLPTPGKRHIAHLVSIEDQYLPERNDKTLLRDEEAGHWTRQIDTTRHKIALISLTHWDFVAQPQDGDLDAILKGISPTGMRLDSSGLTGPLAKMIDSGAVPVERRKADGTQGAGWYRGPLAPVASAKRSLPDQLPTGDPRHLIDPNLAISVDGKSVDDLSVSAAWTLGRLLALADPNIGPELYRLRRIYAHKMRRASQKAGPAPEAFKLSDQLEDWFERSLDHLGAVPFDYLLPEPDFLPKESVAWFTLDPAWMAALRDGALSVGRMHRSEIDIDARRQDSRPDQPISGILLRSKAVSGWPDLIIEAADKKDAPYKAPIRMTNMGPETVMALFEGHCAQVRAHIHPTALHMGVGGHISPPTMGDPPKFFSFTGYAEARDAPWMNRPKAGSHHYYRDLSRHLRLPYHQSPQPNSFLVMLRLQSQKRSGTYFARSKRLVHATRALTSKAGPDDLHELSQIFRRSHRHADPGVLDAVQDLIRDLERKRTKALGSLQTLKPHETVRALFESAPNMVWSFEGASL